MVIARFAIGWAVFVAWTIAIFTLLEACAPRRRAATRWRAVAGGAALLAIDSVVTRLLDHTPTSADLARVAVAWLCSEMLSYGLHRAMHRLPVLWRFHRLHHTREPLAWHVAWRIHPVDAALFAITTTIACAVAGAPLATAAWFIVARRVWTIVLHANIAWPATALDLLIATPSFHARHHDEDHVPANFASTFAFLDRMFGTWRGDLATIR